MLRLPWIILGKEQLPVSPTGTRLQLQGLGVTFELSGGSFLLQKPGVL